MERFAGLEAVVDAMASHGDVTVTSIDVATDPTHTAADTVLSARLPGFAVVGDPSGAYTHCIHRYAVIGGQDITWIGPAEYGSTTGGPFGSNPVGLDVIDQIWQQILTRLHIAPDPHSR